jgi:hypothetical protein
MAQEVAPGLESGLVTAAGAEALKKVLDLLPDSVIKNIPLFSQLSNVVGEVGKNAAYFSGVSEDLTKNLDTVIGLFSKDFDKSITSLTTKFEHQIETYQKLDQSFIQLGRGQNSKAFIESIRQQEFETARLGISLTSLIEINKNLLKSYTGASLLTERQTQKFADNKKAITELVGFNQKFDVSQQDTIQILNLFNNTMGKGSLNVQQFSDSLLMFSQTTGQSAQRVFSEFNSNIERFATVSADKAVASFEKLQMTAARTGQSVQGIISSIEKFDDIETGFQAGGQLNRVLSFMGGSFDTFKAIQASDEERAKMIYESISGVADKFQALQTDQARRSFAKQLVDSTGVDLKTVMGLLNKSTDLSADLADISKKPIVAGEFTEEGRRTAAIRATTADELKQVQGQLMDLNPLVVKLSDNMKDNTAAFTGFSANFFGDLDKKLGPAIAKGGVEGLMTAGKELFVSAKNLPSEFEKYMAIYRSKTKPEADSVISGNTTAISGIKTSLDALNARPVKVEVSGVIAAPTGQINVNGKASGQTSALNPQNK